MRVAHKVTDHLHHEQASLESNIEKSNDAMHILWKWSLDNKKVKQKWNSREQGDLRSSSAILSTRVWLYCTSSENRNANALRLTCTHTTKTISTQCMMSDGISPVGSFLSLEKQQLDPYAWKGFASESITEMRHLPALISCWPVHNPEAHQSKGSIFMIDQLVADHNLQP